MALVATVAVVGRTNAGKSTLVNALVGEKVSIVSPVEQTTRNTIRGIVADPRGQLVLLDTPGLHKAVGTLGTLLNRMARRSAAGADITCVVFDAAQEPQLEDIGWMQRIASVRTYSARLHPHRLRRRRRVFMRGGGAVCQHFAPQVAEHRLVERRSVALVEGKDAFCGRLLGDAPHPAVVLELRLVRRVEEHQKDVHSRARRAGHAVQKLAEMAHRLVEARGVKQHQLPSWILNDAAYRVARGLLYRAHDGHLLAHEPVHHG